MKQWLYAVSFGVALVASAGLQAADKIAVVDVASVFQQLPQREAVAKQLENEFKDRATELQKMQKDLQAKIKRLQDGGQSMKEAERRKLEKDAIAERGKFDVKMKAFEDDNAKRQMEERNKLLGRIRDAVKVVADKEGYDVVMDSNTLAYMNPAKDITAAVLKQVK